MVSMTMTWPRKYGTWEVTNQIQWILLKQSIVLTLNRLDLQTI